MRTESSTDVDGVQSATDVSWLFAGMDVFLSLALMLWWRCNISCSRYLSTVPVSAHRKAAIREGRQA